MQSDSQDNEWLSAYFDGAELSTGQDSDDRSERLSVDAQRTLDDFAELRSLIRSLPRPDAPLDFASAVLARLRDNAASVPEARSTMMVHRGRGKHWLAAICAAAALIAVMVWRPEQFGTDGDRLSRSLRRDSLSVADETAAAEVMGPEVAMSTSLPPGAGDEGGGYRAAIRGGMVADSVDRLRDEILASGRIPERGEVIEFLDREADRVMLVTVSVIDVDVAPGQIRMLLSRNGIQEVSPHGTGTASRSGEPVGSVEDQLAILAIADPVLLTDVLEEMDMLELVEDYYIDEPLAGALDVATAFDVVSPNVLASELPLEGADAGEPSSLALADSQSEDAVEQVPESMIRGVQMDLAIPRDLVRHRFASRHMENEAGRATKARSSAGLPVEIGRPAEEPSRSVHGQSRVSQTMPVLFLIQNRDSNR